MNYVFNCAEQFLRVCDAIIDFEKKEMKLSWEKNRASSKKRKSFTPQSILIPQLDEGVVSRLRVLSNERKGWSWKKFTENEPQYSSKELIEKLGCTDNIRKASNNFHRLKGVRIWRRRNTVNGEELIKMRLPSFYTGEFRVVLSCFNNGVLTGSYCTCPAG